MTDTVHDNVTKGRFELDVEGRTAFVTYRTAGNIITLVHTEVPKELGGRGIGSRLAEGVLALIRARGQKVIPRCQFFAGYIGKHPEYQDLVADGLPAQGHSN
jgi:uncharacterized protein